MKNNTKFYTQDKYLKEYLINYESKFKKIENKIIEFMNVVGTFPVSVELNLYDVKKKDDNITDIIVYCTDFYHNIFTFSLYSDERNNLNIIEKSTDNGDTKYDVSLSKKYELTKDNVDLIKTDKQYNFKYGRLVTDEKSFYSIFLGNDKSYQLTINFKNDSMSRIDILKELNSLDSEPNFITTVKIFENILECNNLEYSSLKLDYYENFEKKESFQLEDNTSIYKDEKTLKFEKSSH